MNIFTAAVSGVLVGMLGLTALPSVRRRAVDRLARRLDLRLEPSLATRIGRRVTLRQRSGLLGALLGVGVGTAILLGQPGPVDGEPWLPIDIWMLTGMMFVGSGIGFSLSALVAIPRPDADAPRVARSRVLGIGDYVDPFELVPTRVLAPTALALAVAANIGALSGAAPASDNSLVPAALVLAVLAIVTLVIFELGARALLRRPTPAVSEQELAWEDGLRATAVRQLLTAPLTFSLIAVIWSGFGLLEAIPGQVALVVVNVATPLLTAGLVVIAVLAFARHPERYFRRRLWPYPAVPPARDQPAADPR